MTLSSSRIKVPEVTALFWVIKVLSTGMGETAADYVDKRSNSGNTKLGLLLVRSFTSEFKQNLLINCRAESSSPRRNLPVPIEG